jgi:hypothetical protein
VQDCHLGHGLSGKLIFFNRTKWSPTHYLSNFFGRIPFSQIDSMKMYIKIYNSTAEYEDLKPCIRGDLNPGSSVMEADVMTTVPRRQGYEYLLFNL